MIRSTASTASTASEAGLFSKGAKDQKNRVLSEISGELKRAAEKEFSEKEPGFTAQLTELGLTPKEIEEELAKVRKGIAEEIKRSFRENVRLVAGRK